jgi:hypothetical protein
MGRAQFDQSNIAPKLRFRITPEDQTSPAPIRVKIEIHTRERTAYDPPRTIPFAVKNPWFTGSADIPTFSKEEILATKVRALLQRDKGTPVSWAMSRARKYSGASVICEPAIGG